jgi:hypothetical protein
LDIQVPEVYPHILATTERLPIAVYGNAIDMVCMSVGIGSSRYCCDNSIMMGEAG